MGDSEWKLQCNSFICLGVEKHNDNAKRAYFSSNKWNASELKGKGGVKKEGNKVV